jgi:hypothetical protein
MYLEYCVVKAYIDIDHAVAHCASCGKVNNIPRVLIGLCNCRDA